MRAQFFRHLVQRTEQIPVVCDPDPQLVGHLEVASIKVCYRLQGSAAFFGDQVGTEGPPAFEGEIG